MADGGEQRHRSASSGQSYIKQSALFCVLERVAPRHRKMQDRVISYFAGEPQRL